MAILVLIVIGVVIVSLIAVVTVPVQHGEAVATHFYWRRTVRIATAVWLEKTAKPKPRRSAGIRKVQVQLDEDPDKRYYTFEKRVWRNPRDVTARGERQSDVRDPPYTLRPGEQKRGTTPVYRVTFTSPEGVDYLAEMRFKKWRTQQGKQNYRLGRNLSGQVRTVKLAGHPPRPPESKASKAKAFDADPA